MNRYILSIVLLACTFFLAFTQDRENLEIKKKRLNNEIRLTSEMLEKTSKHKVALMSRYELLKTDIGKRESLISTMQEEMIWMDSKIVDTRLVITSLDEDLQTLQAEYGELMRYAFRNNIAKSRLLFLLSASSFRQAFQRWRFFKRYDVLRRKQHDLMQWTKNRLTEKAEKLLALQMEKSALIDEMNEEKKGLGDKLTEQNKLLRNLSEDERVLMAELKNQQKQSRELENSIAALIKAEMDRSRRKNSNSSVNIPATPEFRRLSGGFRDNKGKLPWPVKNGVITRLFGNQSHPTLKNIRIKNNGIDIRTKAGENVRAVFDGIVSGVQQISGYSNVVILQHGKYYTVYSHLEKVFVHKGQKIKAGQSLATVRTDPNTFETEVHFEVWEERTRLNPSHWLAQK